MANFDIGVLLLLGASLVYSFFKGMIREIFSILGYVTGYITALNFHEAAAIHLQDLLPNKMLAEMISFSFIFVVSSILVKLIGKWIQKLMNSAGGLSGFDKLMGGVLGLAKGLFILAIVMIPLEFFPDIDKKVTQGSTLSPYLKTLSSTFQQNMFSDLKEGEKPSGRGLGLDKKLPSSMKLPSAMKDVKEQLGMLEKLKNMPGDLKSQLSDLVSSDGKPLDNVSEKSKKELEELLRSKLKK